MRSNRVVTGAGRPAYKNPKDMKIKVTYTIGLSRSVSTVMEVSVESIADMLKEEVYNEIRENVIASKKEVILYGYMQNIEDLD